MANALNRDISGCVILVAARYLTTRKRVDQRKFKVHDDNGGFGAYAFTQGNGVFGVWVDTPDDQSTRIEGWMVEAVVEERRSPASE